MKIKKFILRDETDTQFDDLITFENDVLLDDIYSQINYVKENIEDYTNEDIYISLAQLGKFTIDFIGQLEKIKY